MAGSRPWKDAEIRGALCDWAARNGRPPVFNDWPGSAAGLPGKTAVVSHFGSWSRALRAAGLEAQVHGGVPKDDAELVGIAARVERGESFAAIGRELGVSGQALGRRLARWRARTGGDDGRL